jgi:sulfoxide reductase heme-binding subunit YedZ
MLPWTDRSGRLSPLKIAALVAAAIPLGLLTADAFAGRLGPRPLTAAILDTGVWSVRFLWLTLLVTPLRRILDWPQLVVLRRHLGLTALGYALVHFGLYAVDQQGNVWRIASEIVLRFYLLVGFVALLALVALGSTSFDGAIKRLGAERWNRLHWLIHPIAFLAVFHFALQKRLDISEPLVMFGLLAALWGARWLSARKIALSPLALVGVTLAASAVAGLVEVGWYTIGRGFPAVPVLMSNIDPDLAPRPIHWVLGIGVLVAAIAFARSLFPSRAGGRGRTASRRAPASTTPASEPVA